MAAKYIKQEMPDMNNTGEQKCYYRMDITRNVDTEELMERMSRPGSGMEKARIIQVLTALGETMANLMADGYSVTLDGIGTFSATVGVRKDHEQDSIDGDDAKRNALTLQIDGVNYRADKALVRMTDSCCQLKRGSVNRLRRSPFSKEERWQMAVDYLSDPSHPVMRINDYVELTKVSRTVASRELKEYRERQDTQIEYTGRGTHIVYVRKQKKG